MTDTRIEDRLARLEAENRRLRRIGGGALLGLGALSLMSFAAPAICDTVWAERFVLRDARNKTRITLNAYGTDTPGIAFHDAKGKKVGSIGIASDGAFKIEMIEDGRAVPASFSYDENGSLRLAHVKQAARTGTVRELDSKGIN